MKSYTEKDIDVLNDREHVRMRTHNYLGSMVPVSFNIPILNGSHLEIKTFEFIPAVYRTICEIIDNCVDELIQSEIPNPTIIIESSPLLGMYTIKDNGRGVPITEHKTGKYTPEVVFGSLRSGRNFKNNKDVGVKGLNGVGVSVVNFCSSTFNIEITRDHKRYKQQFTNGALEVSKPSIRKIKSTNTGTSVTFQLDPDVFSDIALPPEVVDHIAHEVAFTNPGFIVKHNKTTYRYPKGLDQIIKTYSSNYYKFQSKNITFYVIFDNEEYHGNTFTWANSSLLLEGGICNTQFFNAFSTKLVAYLNAKIPKKDRNHITITKDQIKNKMLCIGNIKISDPQYDAQAKTRLVGPSLRKEMDALVHQEWDSFLRKNKTWIHTILDQALNSIHNIENIKATKQLKKEIKQKPKISTLTDATSSNRQKCKLIITEGLSAAAMITDVRDPKFIASMPLTGKIDNVWGVSVAKIAKMGKILPLITAIGLIPGEPVNRKTLRYGKLIIATDADVDGGHIMILLVNLFYQFWPELFDPKNPFIHRLITPNVIATTKSKRLYFSTTDDFKQQMPNTTGYTIEYIKGLGSLSRIDYEMILSSDEYLLPLIMDDDLEQTLQLMFSDNVSQRKRWLQK